MISFYTAISDHCYSTLCCDDIMKSFGLMSLFRSIVINTCEISSNQSEALTNILMNNRS
jgi:hypothetical protein